MSENYENKDYPFVPDELVAFECRQAMLRKQYAEPVVDVEWNKFYETVKPAATVSEKSTAVKKDSKTRYFLFGSLAGVAAVLLVLLVFRGYNYYLEQRPVTVFVAEARNQEIMMNIDNGQQNILPGKTKTDPLDGVSIDSRKADFTKASQTKIQTRTIKTPYGKDYRVVLNDGTEVVMNADSRLTFPTTFSGKRREVKLEGEAYFKVAKNPDMPFVVKTNRINTTALGTEFNVRAYKGTDPHVTLIEGSVLVDVPVINKNVKLSPREDVSIKDNALNIKDVDPEYYIQWKEGFFYYDDVALGEVLSDIGRWYNINIEIEKPALMSYRLHFVVDRSAGIDEVVENLNNFRYLNAVKNGIKITIREKS